MDTTANSLLWLNSSLLTNKDQSSFNNLPFASWLNFKIITTQSVTHLIGGNVLFVVSGYYFKIEI